MILYINIDNIMGIPSMKVNRIRTGLILYEKFFFVDFSWKKTIVLLIPLTSLYVKWLIILGIPLFNCKK